MFLCKNIEDMSMSDHQVVHLSKSQLFTTNEKFSLAFEDMNPVIREIKLESSPELDYFSNLKSLGLIKILI